MELSSLMYDRKFIHSDTKEILLYGLNDDDYFDIDEHASSKIKIRIIGGKGNDTFNIRGNVRNYLYDMDTKENDIQNHSHSRILTSSDPHVNNYSATGFKYNIFNFPRILIGYNEDDKFLFGVGFLIRTFGLRKEPCATDKRFATLYATDDGAYSLKSPG